MLQLPASPFLPYRSYKGKLTPSSATQGSSQPWVPHGDSTYLHLSHNGSLSCVATVGTPPWPHETTGTARADWRWGVRGCWLPLAVLFAGGGSPLPVGLIIWAISGWLCFAIRILVISRVKAAGSSTNAFASASGLSRTMAMSISPPSFWISVKILMNPQLSSASSKSFSRRQQTGHTRHKTKCLKFSCYSSHSLVEQHKVTRTSQKQKTAVPTADSRSKVVSDNILRNNQRFRPNV